MEKYTEQIKEIARFAINRGLEINSDTIVDITRQWYLSNKSIYDGLSELTQVDQKKILKIK